MFFKKKNKIGIQDALSYLVPNDIILFNPTTMDSVYQATVLNNHPDSKKIYLKWTCIDTLFQVKEYNDKIFRNFFVLNPHIVSRHGNMTKEQLQLKVALEFAIAKEDYILAASIRDRIKELGQG